MNKIGVLSPLYAPAVALSALFAISSCPARADTITVSIGWSGGDNVYIHDLPGADSEALATTITATNSAVGTLDTYCSDLYDNLYAQTYTYSREALAAGETYATGSGDAMNGVWSQTQVNQLTALLYNGSITQNKIDSNALQIAIWEIEYGTESNNAYNLTTTSSTVFSITSGSALGTSDSTVADAQTYLNDVTSGLWTYNTGGKYQVEYLTTPITQSGGAVATQPLLYLADTSTSNMSQGNPTVPEPASLSIFAVGAAGLACARRRRNTA